MWIYYACGSPEKIKKGDKCRKFDLNGSDIDIEAIPETS